MEAVSDKVVKQLLDSKVEHESGASGAEDGVRKFASVLEELSMTPSPACPGKHST